MQAYLSAAHNPKAAVVIHNTRSCSHIAYEAFMNLENNHFPDDHRMPDNLFCTNLTNKEAVFGGLEKLSACLRDVCRIRRPEYILVANGCVPGITGDDSESICEQITSETGIPILLLPGAGFMVPDRIDMFTAAVRLLLKTFTYPSLHGIVPQYDRAVIIGMSAYYSPSTEQKEIRSLLHLCGVKEIFAPPVYTCKSDYEKLAASSLVVSYAAGVVRKDLAQELAYSFAEKLAAPVLNLNQITGPHDMDAIFSEMIKIRKIPKEVQSNWNEARNKYKNKLVIVREKLKHKRCLLAAGLPRQQISLPGKIRFLEDIGLKVCGIYLPYSISSSEQEEYKTRLREINPQMQIFTSEQLPPDACIISQIPINRESHVIVSTLHHFTWNGWISEIENLTQKISESE